MLDTPIETNKLATYKITKLQHLSLCVRDSVLACCCERKRTACYFKQGLKSRFFGMANEPRFCAVEQHNVRDNVRPLTIKTFCFAVAHFCCVGNFTYYLANITLYCFFTVSLKELFRLFFQSIVDFKSYKRNDIKGRTNRSVAWKPANKPN